MDSLALVFKLFADISLFKLFNKTDCSLDKKIGVVTCAPELDAEKALLLLPDTLK